MVMNILNHVIVLLVFGNKYSKRERNKKCKFFVVLSEKPSTHYTQVYNISIQKFDLFLKSVNIQKYNISKQKSWSHFELHYWR